MLTQTQIANIHKLDAQTCIEIMNECIERLGCVSVKDYCKIMDMPRRTIYDKISNGKINIIKISEHKFPIINT